MASSSGRRGGPIADINVTPLVDVVLVLLIIFMVVTNLDEQPAPDAIEIELPGAATSQSVDAKEPLTVAVDAAGRLVLKGQPATPAEVVAAVQSALESRGDELEVVVSADRRATHDRFVALLDLLRAQGVSRFAIQTDGSAAAGS